MNQLKKFKLPNYISGWLFDISDWFLKFCLDKFLFVFNMQHIHHTFQTQNKNYTSCPFGVEHFQAFSKSSQPWSSCKRQRCYLLFFSTYSVLFMKFYLHNWSLYYNKLTHSILLFIFFQIPLLLTVKWLRRKCENTMIAH